jgi:hypothetical protein
VLPSGTYQGYALLRSILKSRADADIAKAVAYGKRVKLYPLSTAAKPPRTRFVDAIDVIVSGVIPYDVRFFQSLDRMVQYEPWLERDRAMIDPLKSFGIEKGKTSRMPRPRTFSNRPRAKHSHYSTCGTRRSTSLITKASAGSFRPTRLMHTQLQNCFGRRGVLARKGATNAKVAAMSTERDNVAAPPDP